MHCQGCGVELENAGLVPYCEPCVPIREAHKNESIREDLVETIASAIQRDRNSGAPAATFGAALGRRDAIDTIVFALILPEPTPAERAAITEAIS